MKVVFDTNVIISGFLTTTGISEYVFSLAIKRHTVMISRFILEEVERKLGGKLAVSKTQIEPLVQFLKKRTSVLNVPVNPEIRFKDKLDIPILSLVEAAGAHYLVTGDKRLLDLKKFGTTLILTPREALEIL